jgi:hypothetical protein
MKVIDCGVGSPSARADRNAARFNHDGVFGGAWIAVCELPHPVTANTTHAIGQGRRTLREYAIETLSNEGFPASSLAGHS